jgi:cell division septation protein DedD
MAQQVPSRTQRRMEKKQALVLLVLIVAVALASFALGVMVGRGSRPAPPPIAAAAPHLPIAPTTPAAAPSTPAAVPPSASGPAPGQGTPPAAAAADKTEPTAAGGNHLTFYDSLPKGQQPPLGSGINLPPNSVKETAPATAAKSPAAGASAPPPKPAEAHSAPAKAVAVPTKSGAVSAPAAHGAYVVQVASFKTAADAEGLQKRLVGKHYPAFAQSADLGAKGVWHRVLVGPFATVTAAKQTAGQLRAEEHLSALVKKR